MSSLPASSPALTSLLALLLRGAAEEALEFPVHLAVEEMFFTAKIDYKQFGTSLHLDLHTMLGR
jgi:hypothetical protein